MNSLLQKRFDGMERDARLVVAVLRDGRTYESIAAEFGISKGRVAQIFARECRRNNCVAQKRQWGAYRQQRPQGSLFDTGARIFGVTDKYTRIKKKIADTERAKRRLPPGMLRDQQLRTLLSVPGRKITKVADEAGLSTVTVYKWIKEHCNGESSSGEGGA
jgi:transposase-like protein